MICVVDYLYFVVVTSLKSHKSSRFVITVANVVLVPVVIVNVIVDDGDDDDDDDDDDGDINTVL